MEDLVSVIIPCYNAESTILRTLQSLEKQIMQNFEVIIVNDGSLDNTEEIVKNYMQFENKLSIQYFAKFNQGVSCARNYGIKQAKGKYIAFLDADDLYHPQFLQILVREIELYEVDIVCCKYQQIRVVEEFNMESQQAEAGVRRTKDELLKKYLHKRKEKIGFYNAIYKKSIILQNEIQFPKNIHYGEDSEFFCKYLAHCEQGGIFIENQLYGYCYQPLSAMNTNYTWRRADNLIAMQNIINYWEARNLDVNFAEYMYARAVWALAKDFSKAEKELFQRLEQEYDVKGAMKIMVKSGDELSIRASALIYLISSKLFCQLISKVK